MTPTRGLVRVVVAVGVVVATALVPARAAGQTGEWRDAAPDYRLEFPRDHASHPDYKIEWWYYTGNLRDPAGRRFGYQLTFFRVGVTPQPTNPSRWAVRDLFMAHLALTDVEGRRHMVGERFNRAGVGWAGAAVDRYRVWNEQWSAELDDRGGHQVRARDAGFGIELDLEPSRPPVLHGERGYSQKGSQRGNASHYYSLTRMATGGSVWIEDVRFEVTGTSWMDHEFGTSFLEPAQVGWDWFSVHLDDGTDVMLFQLRRRDGSLDPRSAGTVVSATGRVTPLGADDVDLTPGRWWRSPASGGEYPVEWRISVPREAIDLRVRPVLDDQELHTPESTGVIYWEGAVDVTGRHGARAVDGEGYLEMTGYAGEAMGEILR